MLINPLNAELNPICHFLALLGSATIVVVSRLSKEASTRCVLQSRVKNNFAYRVQMSGCFTVLNEDVMPVPVAARSKA